MRRPVQPFLAFRVGALALSVCRARRLSVANATRIERQLGSRQSARELSVRRVPSQRQQRRQRKAAGASRDPRRAYERCSAAKSVIRKDRNSLVLVGGSTLAIKRRVCAASATAAARWNLNLHGKRVGVGTKKSNGTAASLLIRTSRIAAVKAVHRRPPSSACEGGA